MKIIRAVALTAALLTTLIAIPHQVQALVGQTSSGEATVYNQPPSPNYTQGASCLTNTSLSNNSNSFVTCTSGTWATQPIMTSSAASPPTGCAAGSQGMIYYDTGASAMKFCNGSSWTAVGAGGSSTLAALTDATITSPANGNILQYNGTKWVNTSVNAAITAAVAPSFSVNNGVLTQNASPNVALKLNFNTVVFDTINAWSTVNSRYTPTVAGKYLFTGTVSCSATSSAECDALIFKNGTIYAAGNSEYVTPVYNATVSAIIDMNGTSDYVELWGATRGTKLGYAVESHHFDGALIAPLASGGVGGTGTTNNFPLWSNSTTLGTSALSQSGSNIGVGSTSPAYPLDVVGSIRNTGAEINSFGTDYTTVGTTQSDVNLGTSSSVRYNGSGASTFYGIVAGTAGQLLWLHNASSYTLTLSNQSTSDSTLANRIITGTGSDLAMTAGSSVMLQYDGTSQRWRIIGGTGSGSGGGGGQLIGVYSSGSAVSNYAVNFSGAANSAPTLSGSTLILPSNTSYMTVEVWGAGGGGGGGANGVAGGAGGNTCFGTNATACTSPIFSATGGGGGTAAGSSPNSLGSGTGGDVNLTGGAGSGESTTNASLGYYGGGTGGAAPLGGGGGKGSYNIVGTAGSAFGGGGGGGGISGVNSYWSNGGGGNAGGYSNKFISGPSGTYYYTIGSGGTAGTAGSPPSGAGYAGGAGGAGGIKVSVYTSGVSNGSIGSGPANGIPYYSAAGTAVSATAAGTTGTVLTGNTGSAPTFTASPSVTDLTLAGKEINSFGTDYTTVGTQQSDVALGTSSTVRYNGSGASTFYGIVAGTAGQVLRLHNASSYTLTLSNQSTSEATLANRIITGTGSDLAVTANTSIMLQYDGTSQRWRVIGGSGGSSAGTSMVNGWPDAIICSVTNPNFGNVIFYHALGPYPVSNVHYYRTMVSGGNYGVLFNSDGSFNAYETITTTNCNATISALTSAGQTFNFVGGGSGGGSSTLSGLSDVTLSGPANGNILQYNGTKWVNTSVNAAITAAVAPSFLVHNGGTTQSISANTWTKASFAAANFDTISGWSAATNRYTPTVAGKYIFTGSIRCNSGPTQCVSGIYKNGAYYASGNNAITSNTVSSVVTYMIDMNGTSDYVELYGYANGAGNMGGSGMQDHFFSGALLAPLASGGVGGTGTTNNIALWSNSTTLGTSALSQSGSNIGVGSTSPAYPLDVVGSIRNTGAEINSFGSDYTTVGTTQSDVNLGTSSSVRYNGAGASTFYGIVAGTAGQLLWLHNASSYTLTLSNQSTSDSTLANRIITGTGSDLAMTAGSSVMLQYDGTSQRWRIIGGTGAGGAALAGLTGQVQYNGGAGALAASGNMTWDNANAQLTVGTGGGTPAAATGTVASTTMHLVPQAISFSANSGSLAGMIVGTAQNLVGRYVSATTATWTADELITKTTLGGSAYLLASYNKTLNIATTGAGGLDTGAAANNTWYYVYAIYNPTTATQSILATTAGSGANIYAGANMPSGYTASALIGVFTTNGSAQLTTWSQVGRRVYFPSITALNNGTSTSYASLSLASAVPPSAKYVGGTLECATGNTACSSYIASDSSGTGEILANGGANVYGSTSSATMYNIYMITASTVFYKALSYVAGDGHAYVYVSSFEF